MHIFGRPFHPKAFTSLIRMAWRSLWGDFSSERLQFTSLCANPEFLDRMRTYLSDVPQASVVDHRVTLVPWRDVRAEFASRLTGRGLELGALHLPMTMPPGASVRYVDRMSRADLRREYPSLRTIDLVETDIIADAETLATLPDASEDFIIASHLFEHLRNPIGSLLAWARVLRPGGLLYLVLPDKRATFDAHRVRTTLEHLILDFESPSAERDFEHYVDYARFVHHKQGREALDEARKLHDVGYSIHYHVYMPEDICHLVEWVSANVLPLDLVEGPLMAEGTMEFNVLVRKRP
ncbi:MAG: methyltransferase domain-containing protein [Acidobacteria bacterium]|nr:methyltransferase domain-containing protein [Acidobacteriota bacterium]